MTSKLDSTREDHYPTAGFKRKKTKALLQRSDLLKTFDCLCPIEMRVGSGIELSQWNPLSQRLLIDLQKQKFKSLIKDFEEVNDSTYKLIRLFHEATHVFLLEPFFVGRLPLASLKTFERLYLGFEGAAVWHMEHQICRYLNSDLPDGEAIYDRLGITTKAFHQSFAGVGSRKSLSTYVEAFCGNQTSLLASKDPYARDLGVRFYQFYLDSTRQMELFFTTLKEVGILDSFPKRFCKKGLPTFLSASMLAHSPVDNLQEYADHFLNIEMDNMGAIDARTSRAVRVRRSLQTRAYFAMCLDYVLSNDLFFSMRKRKSVRRIKELGKFVKHYLNELEDLVASLGFDSAPDVQRKLQSLDSIYSDQVVRNLLEMDLWISRRLPYFQPQPHFILNEIGEMETSAGDVEIANLMWYFLREKSGIAKSAWIVKKISDFYGEKKIGSINKLMRQPEVAPLWSAPLASIDPENNQFSEILFLYR